MATPDGRGLGAASDDETRLTLVFRRYAQQFVMDEGLLLDVDTSVRREIFGGFMLQLRTQILTDNLPPRRFTARQRVRYEVPTSSWQMWKKRHGHRWYARWLVRRRPVRYEPDPHGRGADAVCTFDLERYRTYPRAKFRLPDRFGPAVHVHAIRDLRWHVEEDGNADAR
jgi:hypothetical protein